MQVALKFHPSTGIRPGFGVMRDWYGCGVVLGFRVWWSALTFTVAWKRKKKAKSSVCKR